MSDKPEKTKSLIEILESSTSNPISVDGIESPSVLEKVHELFRVEFGKEYPELNFNEDEAEDVRKYLSNLRTGGASGIGLICSGDHCEYRHACPLWKQKVGEPYEAKDANNNTYMKQDTKAPEGRLCPLERMVVMDTRLQLTTYEHIKASDPVHRGYINELCQLAAQEWRVNMLLAYRHHGVTTKVPAAISPLGDVYTKREMNQLFEVQERINKRRSQIMKELTISPEALYKRQIAEQDNDDDSISKRNAEARRRLKELTKAEVVPIPDHVKEYPKLTENKNDGSKEKSEEEKE